MLILLYGAFVVFIAGNVWRILRILRTPTHLRWELYPIPKGNPAQQQYGGSYFEETEWWARPPRNSLVSESTYIAREVLTFRSVRKHNPALWLWSWLMHLGLYGFIFAGCVTFIAALTMAIPWQSIWWVATSSACVGVLGAVALLARRIAQPAVRANSLRGDFFNLGLLAALFASALMALIQGERAIKTGVELARALVGMGGAPTLSATATAHLLCLAIFLAHFPMTHMTHAYMKFFTYHRVRWDDTAVAHDRQMELGLVANVNRPISWAAPHVGARDGSRWIDVVAPTGHGRRA